MHETVVGIVDFNMYMPAGRETSADLARATGIPEELVEAKLGLRQKHRAGPDEHVSDMCIKAARPLLAHVPPDEIDLVVYTGSPHKDYPVWLAAPKIQHELGATRAVAFEVHGVSAGLPLTLDAVRSLLLKNPHYRTALLVGASKEGSIIDYGNVRSRFMFNFGDGAVAAVLRRGYSANVVMATAAITDGSFHDFVRMPAGGTVAPPSVETVKAGLHAMDVTDPLALKERLDPVSGPNLIEVAREAARRSGCRPEDIRFVAMLHTKRSLFDEVMGALGVPPERQVYLSDYGHMSALDPLVALAEARQRGLLRAGDLVILLSAGTGFTWAATAVRWGG